MKSLFLLIPTFLALAACVHSNKNKKPPYSPDLPYKPVETSDHTQYPGFGLYMRTCHQCHAQADPATLSPQKWENTVPVMAKHAGITEEEGKLILDYILNIQEEGTR